MALAFDSGVSPRAAAVAKLVATLDSQLANQLIHLSDGRKLGFAEAGDPTGTPVIALGGIYTSRHFAFTFDEEARKNRLRIICPDRPGIGLSDPWQDVKRDRNFTDFVSDIAELADQLSLHRFKLLGQSCGCAYALAICSRLRHRVMGRVTLLSPWCPIDAPGFSGTVASALPLMPEGVVRGFGKAIVGLKKYVHGLRDKDYAEGDYSEDELRRVVLLDVMETEIFRQMGNGYSNELVMCTKRPFGFNYEDIDIDTRLFHGDRDPTVPIAAARWLELQLTKRASCHFVEIKGGDHYLLEDDLILYAMYHLARDVDSPQFVAM